ncbi:hypothetical protein KKB28_06810 [bacterium]|nr:hypothetical protein [bacterium]
MSLKTKILVVLLVLAIIPATALGTVTRVQGLGGWPGTAYIVKDASNPVQFPSTLAYYSHLLYAEFAPSANATSLDRVGAWYGFGEGKCVFGFDIFNRGKGLYAFWDPMTQTYYGMPDIGGNGALPYRANLRWAKPFGDVIVGAALGLYHESHMEAKKADGSDSKLEQKATVIGLDLGVTALDQLLDVALGFEFPSWTNIDADGNTISENDGSNLISFAARYWYHYAEKTSLIPHVEVVMYNNGYSTPVPDGEKAATTDIRLGIGHNWVPVEAVLVVFEVGVRFATTTYSCEVAGTEDATFSDTHLPYWRIGWEGRVYKWLKIRAGASKSWDNTKYEKFAMLPLDPDDAGTSTAMFFGGDFNFGPVVIQYLLDQDFARRGPYFLSGQGGAMFHRFSLFYKVPK